MARPTPPPRELTYVPLARLSEDSSFRIRPGGDISSLARSIAQAGQLFPIEVRPVGDGFQAITGFRRLAALRILHRDRVLVRVHGDISDAAAAMISAADALDNRPVEKEELLELRERYLSMGWSTPALEELIGRAIEKAEERLEDLAAQLGGLPPPDRSIEDEDALDDEEDRALPGAQQEPSGASVTPQGERQPNDPVEPPADPPGAIALGRPRNAPTEIPAQSPTNSSAESPAESPATIRGPGHAATLAAEATASGQREMTPAAFGDAATLAAEATATGPREMTPAALAEDLARRLSLLTQDLATIADAWSEVPVALRGVVADQINYYRQLGAWMDQAPGDEQ